MLHQEGKPEARFNGVIDWIRQDRLDKQALRERQKRDYERWRLTPFVHEALSGFLSYTSSDDQAFHDKTVSWLAEAELQIRIPQGRSKEDERDANSLGEHLLYGLLQSNDDNLARQQLPSLQSMLSSDICNRGWICSRGLLTIDPETNEPYVDITRWDPYYVAWKPGRRGLALASITLERTVEQLQGEFGNLPGLAEYDPKEILTVHDVYDEYENFMLTDGGTLLKEPTPHGFPGSPVLLTPCGYNPPVRAEGAWNVQNGATTGQGIDWEKYGESLYGGVRDISDKRNLARSIMFSLMAMTLRQTVAYKSRGGRKTLKENPLSTVKNKVLSLDIDESIEPLGLMQMTKDAAAIVSIIDGEYQRKTLPYIAFGQLDFQLSGYGQDTLKRGIQTIMNPRRRALETHLRLLCKGLKTQFSRGGFDGLVLQGFGREREYFEESFTAAQVAMSGSPIVKLLPTLPQDDPAKVQAAVMLTEGDDPMIAKRRAREDWLGLPDPDLAEREVIEEKGKKALPLALAYTISQAMQKQQQLPYAEMWQGEFMKLVVQNMMELASLGLAPGGPGQLGENGKSATGGKGFSPNASPNAARGVPPPQPTPQAGRVVEKGRKRPMARSAEAPTAPPQAQTGG